MDCGSDRLRVGVRLDHGGSIVRRSLSTGNEAKYEQVLQILG